MDNNNAIHLKFVGKVSRQGKKRLVIIPLDKHPIADTLEGKQLYIDIWPVYPEEIEAIKRSKK